MIYYLLMTFGIFCGSSNGVIIHKFGTCRKNSVADMFFYNGGMMATWFVTLLIWMLVSGETHFAPLTFLFGALYGIVLGSFQFVKTSAMSLGPVSLTTLIASMSFIVPILYDLILYHVIPDGFQLAGIALIVIALFLCVNPKTSGQKLSPEWFIVCAVYFLIGGFIGIFYRLFGKSSVSGDVTQMMLVASVFGGSLFFLFGRFFRRKKEAPFFDRKNILYVLGAGLVNCLYMRMNFITSPHIPSAIFFPVVNGSIVVLTSLAGIAFFKEKLRPIQVAGIALAILGLIVDGGGKVIFEALTAAL